MTTARTNLIDLDATPYYHCMNQSVRRAFLCGDDEYTGKNYDHRKGWSVERLAFLGAIFAIDVCAAVARAALEHQLVPSSLHKFMKSYINLHHAKLTEDFNSSYPQLYIGRHRKRASFEIESRGRHGA
jgi:hypothetical protein